MVKKLLSLLNREMTGVNQAAFLLAFFSLLSQILGLVRDRAFAHFIGPSAELDIYNAAFRIPDLIYVSVASFASVTVLIPFLVSKGSTNGGVSEESKKFLNDFFTVFFAVIVLVSLAAFALMPALAKAVAPGFAPDELARLVMMSRIMLLSPVLLGLSNLAGVVTQLFKRFALYALSPVLYSIGVILGVLVFLPIFGLPGLAIGVVTGALLHFLIQLPFAVRHGFSPTFSAMPDFASIKRAALVSLPRTVGLSLTSVLFLVFSAIASTLSEGSISIFNFAFHLQAVPLTVVGTSYAVAAFPTLARLFSENNREEFLANIHNGVRQILFWSMPIMSLFIVLRAQIVRVILGTGSFSWTHTRLTAAALALFTFSIFAQSLILLLVRGYYAAGNTRRPLIVNMLATAATVGLSFAALRFFVSWPEFRLAFEAIFRIRGVPGSEVLALPLAYSIGTVANLGLLIFFFKKDFLKGYAGFSLARPFGEASLVALIMGAVAYASLALFASSFDLGTFMGIFLQGFLSGILAIIAGIGAFVALGNREIREIYHALKGRIRSAKVVAPEQGDL